MKWNPTQKEAKKFHKLICKHYDTKYIYTGSWIGKLYKRFVAVPIIHKACEYANAGDPNKWLEDRIITLGEYILMDTIFGKSTNAKKLFDEILISGHEHTHVCQEDVEGLLDFEVKYISKPGIRARFEIEAIKTEMYLTAWNDLSLETPAYYVNKLKRIYAFTEKDINSIRTAIEKIIKEYNKYGIDILSTSVTKDIIKIINVVRG